MPEKGLRLIGGACLTLPAGGTPLQQLGSLMTGVAVAVLGALLCGLFIEKLLGKVKARVEKGLNGLSPTKDPRLWRGSFFRMG